ncbi:hypothetical protein GIB67_008562 [Kingdonia uniflora]|uniref:Alpha-D-phosphohexomutase alpha/beta/alpha domain-containing protein n=1 Tax=Kingdonia uniflora TaxID=39325 RepID=A0A7J7N3L2_9MAGN|nr:hypothetical protein GIB67_008562 [Kingdonia uniflora]
MSVYAKHLRDIINERIKHPVHLNTLLAGFKVIVNTGNSPGGFFTWDVLDKLVADTSGSLNLEPDGLFPNHIPNLEERIAMSITRVAVLNHSADLGMVSTQMLIEAMSYIEGRKDRRWDQDSCGDCWVSEGCLVDLNDTPTAVNAHMYR